MAVERKQERDIDLLLAEEVSVSKPFADWLVTQTRFRGRESSVQDVYVSRADSDGESDLVIIYACADLRFALLIENKIDARFMPNQRARYDIRARKGVVAGEYGEYEVILCSPRAYRESSQDAQLFETYISYEDIAICLRNFDRTPRGIYRADFIEKAAQKSSNYWQRTADKVTDDFWNRTFDIIKIEFPILNMKENQKEKTKGNTWITFRPIDFPKGSNAVGVRYKGDRGFVDLQFSNTDVKWLEQRIAPVLPPDAKCYPTGNAAVVRLTVPKLDLDEALDVSLSNLRAALGAASRLALFYNEHRALFERQA